MTRKPDSSVERTQLSRRSFLKRGAGLAVSISGLSALAAAGCGQQAAAPSPSPTSAPASTAPTPSAAAVATSTPDAKAKLAQLFEGAKKEGAVLWYTTHSIPDAEALNKDFMARYAGVKAEFWRNTNEAILDKVVTEARAGRNAADISYVGVSGYEELKPLVKPYRVATFNDYTADYKDPDGIWMANYLITIAPSYNTNLVKPNEVPKTWEDLLDPKWKGKLSLESNDSTWLLGMLKFMGRDKGLDYLKKLADQKPQIRTSHITQLDLLAAGEYAIVVAGYNYYVEQLKAKGAPVEWIRINPTVTTSVNFGVLSKAPHPNAAMLLMEYLASVEAQQLMVKTGRFPAMFEKVTPNPPSLLEPKNYFLLIKPDMYKEQIEADGIFKSLFTPKPS